MRITQKQYLQNILDKAGFGPSQSEMMQEALDGMNRNRIRKLVKMFKEAEEKAAVALKAGKKYKKKDKGL